MNKVAAMLLSLAASGLAEPVASATSAAELRLACRAFKERPQSAAGHQCRSYLTGFIAGANASGHLAFEGHSGHRGWEERAARTRIGARLQREARVREAEFCLPDPAPIDDLANRIARGTGERAAAHDGVAADLVLVVLKLHYRCRQD